LKRKSVLDLLDKFLGFANVETERHHLEEAVHSLVCPMRTDSAALEIDDHNLWIVDDRLGPVGIQDSHPGLVVIQALDGPIRFE
jgi:hypothetical protein